MPGDDPRLDPEYVRRLPGAEGDGAVVLVGVVHDHPASEHRVREVVRETAPDLLALELAPLAIPLYEQFARDDAVPPARGGEMSTAIQAASTDRVEAIDGPSGRFLRTLLRTAVRESLSLDAARALVGRFASVSRHVLACRAAAVVGRLGRDPPAVESPTSHDASRDDPPAAQAEDERAQVRTAVSILSAFESPAPARYRDETRERHMAARLATLREDGDVVAVVGMGHLDSVADLLSAR